MSKIDGRIAAHPLSGPPYDKIEFVRLNQHRVPLYRVAGCSNVPESAPQALRRAFAKYGGKCFYCPTKFRPHSLAEREAHRDHVLATSKGGRDLLHNLVIACRKCGRDKADDLIHDFKPKAAKAYLAALQNHIANCVTLAE
jgi:5-methylcytosine-specific restriction endonuclease McrA